MGNRTVVILFNDQASEWENDPFLGKRIQDEMNKVHGLLKPESTAGYMKYGRVVQCVHADTQTLAILDSYNFRPLAHSHWYSGQDQTAMQLKLLKEAAEKLGYRLVKKS